MHQWKKLFLEFLIVISWKSIEAVLNFDDENFFGFEADTFNWTTHPCRRRCSIDDKPRICRYVFVVEQYFTMSKACYDCPFNITDCSRPHCVPADGIQKPIYTVNRQIPGPLIEVCEQDIIEVEVRNRMLSESTIIHWHGFKQRHTPYMDGVPYVTQCPIQPGETFQYKFAATTTGTFFWHSHIGSQKSDGIFGPLIVNQLERNNPNLKHCDYDVHRMIVTDWMQLTGDAGIINEYHNAVTVKPTNILINGLGPKQEFKTILDNFVHTPYAVFEVEQNKAYRIRLIDAGAEDCPIEMSIDNHSMFIISLDSNDIHHVEVDAIAIWPGERVDFIIKANQKIGNYWIRYKGYGLCENFDNSGVYQMAILRYKGAKIQEPVEPTGYQYPEKTNHTRVLNPYNTGTELRSKSNVNIPDLNSIDPNDLALKKKADQQIFIEFDFYFIDNYDFHRKGLYGFSQVPLPKRIGTLQFNHISLKMPAFPLLSQWEMLKPNSLCNASSIPKSCDKEQCACTHVINLKLNSVVELVFVDQGQFAVINHPLHLHGHFFRVVATENLNGVVTIDRVKKLDREGKIKRRLDRAPKKDTIKAPGGGYTIVRFYADNPGYWFFHCHFEQHNNVGMALIFKVGEHKDFPKKPKNFPRCGNFLPDVM